MPSPDPPEAEDGGQNMNAQLCNIITICAMIYRDGVLAYGMIPLEQEAYDHDEDELYLMKRKRWNWLKYKI